MEQSQVLLKTGDRVLTSKGKIGVITENQEIWIGYYSDKDFVCEDTFNSWEQVENTLVSYRAAMVTIPQVRIGKHIYPIKEEHLTKLDKLFPVKVVFSCDMTGMSGNQELVLYLPQDTGIFHCSNGNEGFMKKITSLLQSHTGERYHYIIDISTL